MAQAYSLILLIHLILRNLLVILMAFTSCQHLADWE